MRISTRVLYPILAASLLLSLNSGCSRKAKTERRLRRADAYFEAGQLPKAEVEYLNALQLEATNSRAIGRLGAIYYEQGRFGRAFALLSKARELTPNDLDLRIKLATIYLTAGKSKEAREELNLVLDQMPTNSEAPMLLAESVNTKTNLEQVRLRLDRLSAQVGETAPLQIASGVLQLRQGKLKEAEAAFKRAQALDPKSSAASYALGNLCWAQNDLKGADAALKAAAELSPARSIRRLGYAGFKIKTGELQEGKRLLAEISKQAPDYLPAWLRQAEIALAERNFTNCAALLNQALAHDSVNYEALLLRARLLLAQGDAAKAIAELERTTKLYEGSAQAHYQLALAHLVNNESAQALNSLNQAVILDPNFSDAVLALAELNIRKGNPAPAIASLTQLVKQRPQIPQGHLLLANAYLMQNNRDEAAAVYTRMLTIFPKSPQVPLLLGIVLAQQDKKAEARKAFEKSLELAPDYLLALEQLIDLDIAEKQYSTALERVSGQIQKNTNAATPQLLLAKIHIAQAMGYARQQSAKLPSGAQKIPLSAVPEAQTDVAQAEAALLKAIELEPNLQPAYLLLAQLYVASNKHQQALDRLTGLVARTNNVAALMQIGMINDELKNFTAARDAYEKLLTTNPRFSPALNNLAYLYSEPLGQLDKAYEMADKARQLAPSDPNTADTLGWVLYKRGEYLRALGLIEESATRLPADAEIQFHLGMTHYMLGDESPARVALQQAVQASKIFPGKEEAGRRLAVLAIDAKTADASALALLEKRLAEEPGDPAVLSRLAAIYERDGAIDKAVKTYENALKEYPKNAHALGRLAQLYSGQLHEPRKGLELAKEAHSLAPDDPDISHILGRLVFQAGDYKWALSLIQEAASKLPEQPTLLYDLAWAYYNAGRVGEAETTMQSALQQVNSFPQLDDAKQFLAMLAAAKSPAQAQAAAAQLQQVLKVDPNYVPGLMAFALVQEQQSKYEETKQIYEKILAANSLFVPAARNFAILCAQRFEDDPKAYDLAVKAREAFPDDPEVTRALGILAFKRRDDSRAAQLLAQCAQKSHGDGELFYYLGMAHYRLKHQTESKAALQQALALNLQAKFASEAKRVLLELK